METEDIGTGEPESGWGRYSRGGLIMDLHLSGKLSWNDARAWAKEFHADDTLHLLEGQYHPDAAVRMHRMDRCVRCKAIFAPFQKIREIEAP